MCRENRVRCAEALRVQAYFDAELDAVSAAEVEHHLERCAECGALLQDLEQVRGALRRESGFERAPAALRAKIMSALDQEEAAGTSDRGVAPVPAPATATASGHRVLRLPRRMRPVWRGALGGFAGTALAAGLAFFLLAPRLTNPLLDELANAHVRSLMAAHLIDVVSTDKHTVKPWFAGHTDVSPVVADFEAQGYKLIGGRVDYLDHQRSAVVVYQHGAHVINIFSWAGKERALPPNVNRDGYHFVFWKSGDLEYCAVSDTARDELLRLVRLLQDQGAREG
jgi:mycothiol system anti-sigma-R factor